jgi:molybdenum cofactor biosynthesis enzyme MoaA
MSREKAYKEGTTPDYYTGKYKGIKAIDVIHDFELTHCKASALEYILRSGKKDDEVQDLRKAINHLQMQIEFIESVKFGRLNFNDLSDSELWSQFLEQERVKDAKKEN